MVKTYPWTALGFETGDALQHGQQAIAYRVRRATDPPDQYAYVAKKLRRQGDDDRRALFFNEVESMRVLEHPGVAKLVETNADQYRDRSVQLFIITEAIVGTDLEVAAKSGTVSFNDAVRITLGVLDILRHCHARGVLHRDIKPCHVILRDNSPIDPVLIDFGIAYNAESQPPEAETKEGDARGNNFLTGPEHSSGNPIHTRNVVTDICQCLGLLFYAITRQYPRSLRDTDSKKPHEKYSIPRDDLPPWKHKRLIQIFDVGFEWEPNRRWQLIDRLIHRLESLLNADEAVDPDSQLEIDSLVLRAKTSSSTARMEEAQRMASGLVEVVREAVNRIKQRVDKLQVNFGQGGGGFQGIIVAWTVSLTNKIASANSKAVQFVVSLSASDKVEVAFKIYTGHLKALPDNQPYQLGSFDLGDPECYETVRPLIETFLAKCVGEALGVDEDT